MRKLPILTLTLAFFGVSVSMADVIFDDGGTYNVSYTITDIVRVQNHSTVNLLSGGVTENVVYVHSNSYFNVSGGTVKKLVHAYGAYVTVSDGVIEDYLESYNYAGTVKSHITVSGGQLQKWLKAYNGSEITITGGSIQALRAYNDSRVSISGGVFTDTWDEIICTDNGIISIYGTGFNYDYGEIPVSSGTLIGTLESGEAINNNFRILDSAAIFLIPEQGTLLVDTLPVKAEVFVNDMSWGRAPQSREVEVGEYTVSFGGSGGYVTPSNQQAFVQKNTTTSIVGTYVLFRLMYNIELVHTASDGHNLSWPRMNDLGEIVWSDESGHYDTREIFSSIQGQVTNNSVEDIFPEINNSGQIVWRQRPNGSIILDGTPITATNPFGIPKINDSGEIVWIANDGIRSNVRGLVVPHNPPEPALDPIASLEINNLGEIVYRRGVGESSIIMSTVQGVLGSGDHPAINDLGEVVWIENGQILSSTRGFITEGTAPEINNNGDIAFWSSGTFVYQNGDEVLIDSSGVYPSINNLGEVAFWKHIDGHNTILRAVPIPTGDFEPDGDVDLVDFAIFALAWQSQWGDDNWNQACDISDPNDDVIDYGDLSVFTVNWLAGLE